jgi:hypothetical protein
VVVGIVSLTVGGGGWDRRLLRLAVMRRPVKCWCGGSPTCCGQLVMIQLPASRSRPRLMIRRRLIAATRTLSPAWLRSMPW